MADVKAKLLRAGKPLFNGALSGLAGIGPTKFRVGDAAGFEPLDTHVNIRGQLVFEGQSGLIQVRSIAEDTVRYTMTITEAFGPFDIGNIVMFADNGDGNELSLFSVVLPFKVRKELGDPDLQNSRPFPTPGNRFTINVTIKHSIDADDIVVEVVTPEYSNLAMFDTMLNIPPAAVNPFSQFVVQNDMRVNTPTLGAMSDDGNYWGIPFWQNLRSPKFGVIDGGTIGDGHKPEAGGFMWGYFYLTPNALLSGTLGGSGYLQGDDGYVGIVGGMSYTGE